MNTAFLRRARISFLVGSTAVLVGLAASACDSSPASSGQGSTPPIPTSTATSSTHAEAPAAPVADSSKASEPAAVPTTKTPRPAPKPEPLLGTVWSEGQEGYGTAHPKTIYNGGDPTGWVTDVHWQSWGDPVAIGTGMASDARNTVVADAPQRKATVRAFNLGVCKGKLMYQAIEWYFPSQGDKFDPHHYINICTGEYVGS
ncbi:hypothetical protein [Actinocrispum sp. NPDC049592]|uniref:hypothetical protein n=1 Tax=Actinocrispum sp. NPDC049592 TaxID=3154835 RepID=UPI0034146461